MRRSEGMGALLWCRMAIQNWCCLALVALFAVQTAGCGSLFRMKRASTVVAPAPDPFLGPADFHGDYAPRPGPTWNGLQSSYSGTVAVTMVDREVVKKLLPTGLFLAQPKPSAGGVIPTKHPVVHLIGDQREPSTLLWGYPQQVALPGYEEMILIVPFVVRDAGTKWHNYVPRMYLNDQLAVDGGNEFYGYAKELARLDRTQDAGVAHHKVYHPDLATTWFLDDIDVPAQWSAMPGAAATLARWDDIRSILEMPILGLRPADVLQPSDIARTAVLICSYWDLSFANASLAATVSRHRVVTKFRAGMEDWEAMGTLTSARDGAISLRNVRWRLAMPPQGC